MGKKGKKEEMADIDCAVHLVGDIKIEILDHDSGKDDKMFHFW